MNAIVPRPARQYTDEQRIHAAVAARMGRTHPRLSAAQADAVAGYTGESLSMNEAIERAVANGLSCSSIVRASIAGASAALLGVRA